MKTIFIIDGTSGIWKSDLINYVSACNIKSGIFEKCSTREKRPEEEITDLHSSLILEICGRFNGVPVIQKTRLTIYSG